MGWSGGTELGGDFWSSVRDLIPEEHRKTVATKLIRVLENQDCDTVYELEQLVIDAGLEEEYGLSES